jgi:alpha-N-acetylglucosamine transferase
MKKAVFTVIVDNYKPDMCAQTIPTIKAYADKISADYIIIDKRTYPDFPPTYEKMQIYELGQGYDFCILIDADFIIDKNAPDFTVGILPNYVGVMEAFNADNMFEMDEYFKQDGRNIGLVSNFVITDKNTHRLWEPLGIEWAEAKKKTKREFIIDEYTISRNLAKYKFNFTGLNYNDDIKKLFYHIGATTE